ncbi:hypothetical protein ASD24_29640 [Paenibacillus sp. Root52]|uniref:hypothetical protein n=1 Tax=Paenibacillus sp. Root52 TaxID=1736552 RepID=UPI0006F7FEDD|nr:hypothetical protein [Paenibacillus sp. Root52]KQY83681.1 hypothetical protein ASD24_29640 [Paenibacillus sp. Root52]
MNFERMAIRRMRNWFRRNSVFRTGRGAIVNVIEHDSRRIYFKSQNGRMVNTIELSKLKAAIHDLFIRRTITRKQLEVFSNFSSALLGLLRSIFKGMSKLTSGSKGFRLTLIGVRFYFSGCDRAVRDLEVAKENGAKFVLMSYYYLRDDRNLNCKKHVTRLGLKLMLDSGAFTIWKQRAAGKDIKEIDVRDYAEFVLQNQDVIHSYITLDVVGDPEATIANDAYLRSVGLSPVPVFPAVGDLQELKIIIEQDHDIIAIGATVGMSESEKRILFEKIFTAYPEERFHWLGGSSSLIQTFPWFSADSSTWLSGRKYGKVLNEDLKTIKAPESMNAIESLAHNVRILARLESKYIHDIETREETIFPSTYSV